MDKGKKGMYKKRETRRRRTLTRVKRTRRKKK